jgi:hypothetical protein
MRLYLATNLCHIGSEVRRRNYSEQPLVKSCKDLSMTHQLQMNSNYGYLMQRPKGALLGCEKEQDIELLLYRAGTF